MDWAWFLFVVQMFLETIYFPTNLCRTIFCRWIDILFFNMNRWTIVWVRIRFEICACDVAGPLPPELRPGHVKENKVFYSEFSFFGMLYICIFMMFLLFWGLTAKFVDQVLTLHSIPPKGWSWVFELLTPNTTLSPSHTFKHSVLGGEFKYSPPYPNRSVFGWEL